MRYTYTVSSYNDRRYSKPWIALITDWPIGGHPKLQFSCAIDNQTAELEANPGTIVKLGQKDYRKPSHSINNFGVTDIHGNITIINGAEARKLFEENKKLNDYTI